MKMSESKDAKVKESILNAAFCEFCEKKYDNVSILSITERAQVTRSSFYYYFKDKNQIYKTIIERLKHDIFSALDKQRVYDIPELLWAVTEKLLSYKGTDTEKLIINIFENMRSNETAFFDIMSHVKQGAFCNGNLSDSTGIKIKDYRLLGDQKFVGTYFKGMCFMLVVRTVLDCFTGRVEKSGAKKAFEECANCLKRGFIAPQ